jgi:small-conductance mechanosensitive channel
METPEHRPRLWCAFTGMPITIPAGLTVRLRGPVVLWAALLALYFASRLANLDPSLQRVVHQTIIVALVVSVTWVFAWLAGDLIGARARAADRALHTPHLVTNLTRAIVITLGGLIALQTLGIPITPLVTALGVGGLAVGLALQDTPANLFAGIHILISRQFRRGDFIRLSSGEEGYVEDVTWRYTTIRHLPNYLTIVPNARLASAITANFNLPDAEQAVLVDVTVAYESDLALVERATVDVATGVMREVEGGCPLFQPFVRYHTLGDLGIRFTVILRGKDYVAQYLITHEFIKRLHQRYTREGIQIPLRPGYNGEHNGSAPQAPEARRSRVSAAQPDPFRLP